MNIGGRAPTHRCRSSARAPAARPGRDGRGVFVEDQVVDRLRRERVGRRRRSGGCRRSPASRRALCTTMRWTPLARCSGCSRCEPRPQRCRPRAAPHSRGSARGSRSVITAAGSRQPACGGATRSMCSLQRGDALAAIRSGNSVAEVVARADHDGLGLDRGRGEVSTRAAPTAWTATSRRKVTPCALRQPGRQPRDGVARFDPQFVRAPERAGAGSRAAAREARARLGRGSSTRSRRPSRSRRKASSTGTRLGPARQQQRGRACSIGMPACGATSAQTSRERMARRQLAPRSCPVTVTKPKLRTEAPLACASRSITTTRLPRRTAASACARPRMPAPTTARSKFMRTCRLMVRRCRIGIAAIAQRPARPQLSAVRVAARQAYRSRCVRAPPRGRAAGQPASASTASS